jgi:hypothetical protein
MQHRSLRQAADAAFLLSPGASISLLDLLRRFPHECGHSPPRKRRREPGGRPGATTCHVTKTAKRGGSPAAAGLLQRGGGTRLNHGARNPSALRPMPVSGATAEKRSALSASPSKPMTTRSANIGSGRSACSWATTPEPRPFGYRLRPHGQHHRQREADAQAHQDGGGGGREHYLAKDAASSASMLGE